MIFILKGKLKRIFLYAVTVLFLAFLFVISSSAATPNSVVFYSLDDMAVKDGVYNIVNRENGQYLDTYDFSYDPEGTLYLDRKTGMDGQEFLVKRMDDGTYVISPRSDNGAYYLTYSSDIMEGVFVTKKEKTTLQSTFKIVEDTVNGGYIIKPAGMSDDNLALGISSEKSKDRSNYAGITFDKGTASERWDLVRISSESLTISGGYTDIKVGTTVPLYAKYYPEYLIANMEWSSSDPEVAEVDFVGNVKGISEGYATITVVCGESVQNTTVRVTACDAFTWYSQHNNKSGGWFADPVADITMRTLWGERKKFFIYGYNHELDWMDEGCLLCAESMVLHNMGAVLASGYDMRTGKVNNLAADPYTVMLANTGASGYDIERTGLENEPVLMYNNKVTSRFVVDENPITTTNIYGVDKWTIKEQLEKHPEGVIVHLQIYSRDIQHWLVFTKCENPDDPNGNFIFRVCDSAASEPEKGDNVLFEESYSYTNIGYRYMNITGMFVFDVVK